VPRHYAGWDQVLLDIDPEVKPDVCLDALKISTMKPAQYDAVFCSHNLEHFYRHDVPTVLAGFQHVLKRGGWAEIAVPDVQALMESMVREGKDLESMWYRCSGGPISYHDVLYGWNAMMEEGNLFYSHKCGFTEKSLGRVLREAGFASVRIARDGYNLVAFAFKTRPSQQTIRQLGV
jgi:predicted SAM-dependent methyltransferase